MMFRVLSLNSFLDQGGGGLIRKETREYLLNLKDDGGDDSWIDEVWDGSADEDDAITLSQTLDMTKRWWATEQN